MISLFAVLIGSSSAATTTTTKMMTTSGKKTTTTMGKTGTTGTTGTSGTTGTASTIGTTGTTSTTGTTGTTTTTTTTVLVTTVSGEIVLTATGLNETVVQQASKKAVAAHYNVSETIVSVTVTKTRRLNGALRRLADTWKISYEFDVPSDKADAVATKVNAAMSNTETFKQDFTQVFKEKLIAAGASSDAVNSIVVTSATSQATTPGAATSQSTSTGAGSSDAYRTCASVVAITLTTLLSSGI